MTDSTRVFSNTTESYILHELLMFIIGRMEDETSIFCPPYSETFTAAYKKYRDDQNIDNAKELILNMLPHDIKIMSKYFIDKDMLYLSNILLELWAYFQGNNYQSR